MTFNDSDWSVFWSRGNSAFDPAGASVYIGKHVGEDTDTTRNDETLGVIVFEAGSYSIGSDVLTIGLGTNTIPGLESGGGTYTGLNGTLAVVTQAGMNGADGGWAMLDTNIAPVGGSLVLGIDEDEFLDNRGHINEQVSYVIFSLPVGALSASIQAPVLTPSALIATLSAVSKKAARKARVLARKEARRLSRLNRRNARKDQRTLNRYNRRSDRFVYDVHEVFAEGTSVDDALLDIAMYELLFPNPYILQLTIADSNNEMIDIIYVKGLNNAFTEGQTIFLPAKVNTLTSPSFRAEMFALGIEGFSILEFRIHE